jgi:hypothetical protein
VENLVALEFWFMLFKKNRITKIIEIPKSLNAKDISALGAALLMKDYLNEEVAGD